MKDNKSIQASLEALIADVLHEVQESNEKVSAIQVCVDTPKFDLFWSGSIGEVQWTEGLPVTANHPVRIASTTKAFVAATILRLCEKGQINLDGALVYYVSTFHVRLLKSYGYHPESMTVRHLLTHTSGLYNYADSLEFEGIVGQSLNYRWTRTAQIQLAMDAGEAYGEPGEIYRYSDTGYILLGEIIELVTGQSLGQAMSELLRFDQLGLSSTWLEIEQEPPVKTLPRVHQYVGEQDYHDADGSFDIFGGGGLISTVGDMTQFIGSLFRGCVFNSATTLEEMLTTVDAKSGGPVAYESLEQIPGTYRLGLEGNKDGIYGHGGYFGTYMGYVPSLDLALSCSVNQHYAGRKTDRLINGICKIFGIDQ